MKKVILLVLALASACALSGCIWPGPGGPGGHGGFGGHGGGPMQGPR